MKFTTATAVAVFAAGAMAAPNPAPNPDANPWCTLPGQPCWKAKRVAEAFAEAIQSSGGVAKRTPEAEAGNLPGGAGYAVKRAVNELANLIALTRDNPQDYYKSLGLGEQFEADAGNQKREAAPEPWCWLPGQPCWKAKRAADDVLEAIGTDEENTASHVPFNPAGHVPAFPSFTGHGPAWWKREAAPEPEAEADPWCTLPGQPCWKEKREATPEPWCWLPGQPCWKAKRDLHAIRAVAEGISAGFA